MTTTLPMTPGRRVTLAAGTPLALAVIGWSALTGVAWLGQGSYPVSVHMRGHYRTLRVTADAGAISIGPGTGISIGGTARYALTRSSVNAHPIAGGVEISSQCRQLTGPCTFDYRVTVPAGQRTAASLGSGTLTAAHLSGPVALHDRSGHLETRDLSGDAVLTDDSGPVTASAISGRSLSVSDYSGSITVTGLSSADVTATDRSGEITLVFTRVPDRVTVSDWAGAIRIVLPPGITAYHVRASTRSGHAVVTVPTASISPHVITATDASGGIEVTRWEGSPPA